MAGFWDAEDRVARALPAEAMPRPHSPFEAGDPFASTDEMEEIVREVDAPRAPVFATTLQQELPAALAPPRGQVPVAPQAAPDHAARTMTEAESPPLAPARGLRAERERSRSEAAHPREIVTTHIERHESHRTLFLERVERASSAEHAMRAVPRVESHAPAVPMPSLREAATHPHDGKREAVPLEVAARPAPASAPAAVNAEATRPAIVEAPRPLVVEIDRIEIRIEPERPIATPAPRPVRDERPVPSLEAWLARSVEEAR
jgi:hypothetical protein